MPAFPAVQNPQAMQGAPNATVGTNGYPTTNSSAGLAAGTYQYPNPAQYPQQAAANTAGASLYGDPFAGRSHAVQPVTANPTSRPGVAPPNPFAQPAVYNQPMLPGGSGVAPPGNVQQVQMRTMPAPDYQAGKGVHPQTLLERLRLPAEIPGANARPIIIPPRDPQVPATRYSVIDKIFPNVPSPRPIVPLPLAPDQRRMTLPELHEIALANNPQLVQAQAAITSFYGNAVQAGTHPNPVVGYEADTVGSAGTRNYQGIFFNQQVKTAGKLNLARSAANVDVMNAQLNVRKTRVQVMSQVNMGYYAVLVAQENVHISDALVRFTNEVYRIQVEKLREGEATNYEPAQLRSLAVQARSAFMQSQNRYISAWKQLAALMGTPNIPPVELEGHADMPVPEINFDQALSRLLTIHPDVAAARNSESQARIQLQLEKITPVPDVLVYGAIQKDFTTPGRVGNTYNMQVGVPLPLFDRNRGRIVNQQGDLVQATQQIRRMQNELTAQLADAFERYQTNRVQLSFYRDQILPDLARAYKGIYERHQQESSEVGFGDVIVAQQNLANAIGIYIATLTAQWQGLTDLANLLQVEDLNELYNLQQQALPPPPEEVPPPGPVQGGRQ
jgi:cobalt-zinc-cadmium efflux system outer membrane protein